MSDGFGAGVQLPGGADGANTRTNMNDLPPPPPNEPEKLTAFTVRLTNSQHDDLQFVADLWNAMDKALGHKRRRKWKPSSVVATYISSGLDRFWERSAGNRPITKSERKAFIDAAVARALEKQKK